ncbi:MAG: hypothetical protein IJU18_06020 [Oscillospiraceae bacterium]|nr:hypothetical protein [Oscillospiraceae bacterium]
MKEIMKKYGAIGAAAIMLCATAVLWVLYATGQLGAARRANALNVEWYDERQEEFVITKAEELYDLAALSEYYDFKDQTIKLGEDIVINEGDAAQWAETPPANKWYPITGFAGTFDGQGHSISGLYAKGSDVNLGLFSDTGTSCVVKDLKILNSYFRVNGNFAIGSVSAGGSGTFSGIYSNAIMESNGSFCGGLFGTLNVGSGNSALSRSSKISNCWFDGSVILHTKEGRYGGGIAGSMRGGSSEITHCLNTGSISSDTVGERGSRIGGLIGGVDYVNNSGTLRLEDCLNAGPVKGQTTSHAGSVIGTIGGSGLQITVQDVYATAESAERYYGWSDNDVIGMVRLLNSETVKGPAWYQWSTLDFKTYWAATEDGVPALKTFAPAESDVTGLEKAYDISWYNDSLSEFELTTREQLIGLSILSQTNTFEGKTILLGADIVMNEGTSEEWLKKTPDYIWTPIGSTIGSAAPFSGTFDGQGHTISGLYARTADKGLALFRSIGAGSKIRNLKITNTYFEYIGDNETTANLASVAGRCYGNLDTVFSDATLVSSGLANGGMTGQIFTSGFCTISNCWYDGDLTMTGNSERGGRFGGGIVGRIESGQTTIQHCLFSGSISSEAQKTGVHIGGFVGYVRYARENEGVRLNITDSLMSGTVDSVYVSCVASAVGRVFEQVTATLTETYVVDDNSHITTDAGASKAPVISRVDPGGTFLGGCIVKPKEQLTGYNGYIWTILDFDRYWTVVPEEDGHPAGTPVLKSFAASAPSLDGVARMIDVSWYDADKTSYTITDRTQLYGLAELSGGATSFAGKTVYLGADIAVNGGDASSWKDQSPANVWQPIGAGLTDAQGFDGILDGQGHTVSGLYYKSDTAGIGLFRNLGPDGVVRNLKVTNSYFEYTGKDRTTAAAGGVVGRSYGDIYTVYSSAIVRSTGLGNGGIVGQIYGDDSTTVSNCWFDGTVAMLGSHADAGQHGGGIAGRIERGSITIAHCLSSGVVSCEADKTGLHAGGLLGYIRYEKENDGTSLYITDSLVTGKVQIIWNSCAGAVVGRVFKDVTATIENTYALKETCEITRDGKVTYGSTVGFPEGTIDGGAIIKHERQMVGDNGYVFSQLNFDDYWTVVPGGTPVLQSFAESTPSVAGLKRRVDISWYDPDKTSYTINTIEQLYGLADVISGIDNMEGKTVRLGADITDNAGTVDEWKAKDFAGLNVWEPFGTGALPFRGNFDGQGHTISGLYMTGDGFQALFGRAYAKNITLRDFTLRNTYIKSTGPNNASVVSVFRGNLERIYSDAEIVVEGPKTTARYATGGMIGYIEAEDTRLSECWFDGSITSNGQAMGGLYGVQYNTQVTTVENCLVTGKLSCATTLPNQVLGGFGGSIHGNWVGSNLAPRLIVKSSVFAGSIETAAEGANMAGLFLGQISTKNPEGGVWITDSYAAPCGNWNLIGWQAESAVVTDDGGATKYTGSCAGMNAAHRRAYSEITVLNKQLGLSSEVWCDVDAGAVLLAFAGGLPRTVDTSWYDSSKTTYTLTTKEQLLGMARLNDAQDGVFTGKTILLGADIALNEGTVEEWKANDFAGLTVWTPVGMTNAFRGTFDGQGHTISGVYVNNNGRTGLFANAYDGAIRNLRLTNSYIKNTTAINGSIVGNFRGTLEKIYSDAEIEVTMPAAGQDGYTGGIVGRIAGEATVSQCWYAGTLTTNGKAIGGVAGAFYNENGTLTIENCLMTGTLNSRVDAANHNQAMGGILGGVIGVSGEAKANVITSVFSGTLNTADAGANMVGFLVGVVNGSDLTRGLWLTNSCGTGSGKGAGPIGYQLGGMVTDDNGATKYTGSCVALTSKYAKTPTEITVFNDKLGLNPAIWCDVDTGAVLTAFADGLPRTVDLSWYDKDQTTYTLTSKEQFLGMARLNDAQNGVFNGKTILLDADITLNEGTVEEWKASGFAGLTQWTPMGATNAFRGTFDGQGHTISGLYASGSGRMALFANAYDATIRNLRLTNSFIASNTGINGSIVGNFRGTVEKVYSNAVIEVTGAATSGNAAAYATGGMVGRIDSSETTFDQCWFDGSIAVNGTRVGGIVGEHFGNGVVLNINNCLVSGDITTTVQQQNGCAGGFLGQIWSSNTSSAPRVNITGSVFTGTVTHEFTNGNMVGLAVGGVSATSATGGAWLKDSYFAPSGKWNVVGWQANSATVTDDGGTTKYTGSCTALTGKYVKPLAELTVSGIGLDGSIWKDSDHGPVLTALDK